MRATTPDICPVIGRGRPMEGRPEAPRWWFSSLCLSMRRGGRRCCCCSTQRAHSPDPAKHRSHYHYGRRSGGVADTTRTYTGRYLGGGRRGAVLASVLDRCISPPPPTVTREYQLHLCTRSRGCGARPRPGVPCTARKSTCGRWRLCGGYGKFLDRQNVVAHSLEE